MMADIKRKVPNLRFKGFTDYWEQHKLGDIAKVTKLAGFEFTKYINYSSKGKILAIRGLNIKDGKFNLQDVKYIDNSDFNKLTRSKLRQDDILFTYVGTIGNSAIVPAGVKWYLAPNVCLIRTQTENAKFISHLIQSDKFQHQEIPKWITTSSQPALSMENIRKFSIILPTISEQLKISNLVSIIDTIITLQQRKLEQFKQLKKALLQQLFVDKNNKQPNLRFKNFNGDWEQRKLGELIESLFQGINTAADKVEYSNNGLPIIQAKNITSGSLDFSGSRKLSVQKYSNYLDKYIPQKGDILFANIGTIGPNVILKDTRQFFIAWNILRIVPQKNINGEFLKITLDLLNSKHYFEKLLTGNATKFVNKNDMRNLPIFFSDPEEQNKISNLFKKLDFLITLQQQKLAKYQSIKKSLLQQMFI